MDAIYKEVAELLVRQGPCIALTGAGISAESGIPTFRSKGGLWDKYDPMVYASAEVFRQDPSKSGHLPSFSLQPIYRFWRNKTGLLSSRSTRVKHFLQRIIIFREKPDRLLAALFKK